MSKSAKPDRKASAASLNLTNLKTLEEPIKEKSLLEMKKIDLNDSKPDAESKIEPTVLKSATPTKIEPNVLKPVTPKTKNEVKSAKKNAYEQNEATRSLSGIKSANTNDIKSARRVQNPENVKSASKSISDKNRNMVVSEYEVEKGVETVRNPFTHFKGFSSIPSWIIYLIANLAILAVVILVGITLGFVFQKVCNFSNYKNDKLNVII